MTFAALLTIGVACASTPATCEDVALTREAQEALDIATSQIDFMPERPCSYGRGFVVTSVTVDRLPGVRPQARLSFIVQYSTGERGYVFSQTRAPVTSTQIPQSTHRVWVSSGAIVAEGFSGPTGSGVDATYLRWRTNEVTYELDATLGRRLTDAEVQRIAAALMVRSATARPPVSVTPSAP